MCSTTGTLLQKTVFPVPELFSGLSNMKASEAEKLYIEALGPTSQNLGLYMPSLCAGLLKICLEISGLKCTLCSDSVFRRAVKEPCCCDDKNQCKKL